MRTTFDADYSEPDFRELVVGMEYPVAKTNVPSIWVDFDPIGPLHPVGIGHVENVQAQGGFHRTTRWSFAGNIVYTAIAMSSLERDRIVDQMIAIIGFGQYDSQRGEFRDVFEKDPLVKVSVNWDEIDLRGFSAAPGTPWGTDDMLYEASLSISCEGEFVSTPGDELLVPISSWRLFMWVKDLEKDPTTQGGWIG